MSTVTPTMRAIVVDDKKNLAVEEVPTNARTWRGPDSRCRRRYQPR